jgi:Na+/citrate or Na+/malate symporter
MLKYLRVVMAALRIAFGAILLCGAVMGFASGNVLANLVFLIMLGSLAAGILIIADTFQDYGGRFSLSTFLLVVMLFALSLCALGVFIHTPTLHTY